MTLARYVATELALLTAPKINPDATEGIGKERKKALSDALGLDAVQGPRKRQRIGTWSRAARGWGRTGANRGVRTWQLGARPAAGKSAVNAPYVVFNGGEIGVETINRVTLDNYAACAERQENTWLDSNGPMSLRPGFGHQAFLGIGKQRLGKRFSRSMTERFILCLSANSLRALRSPTLRQSGFQVRRWPTFWLARLLRHRSPTAISMDRLPDGRTYRSRTHPQP